MSHIMLMSPQELARLIASKARAKRLSFNLSQKNLANRSGVSLASLKVFEQHGKISLESLLKIAFVLDSTEEFISLFKEISIDKINSLDELLKNNLRKRGRK